jgi:uncharacterized phage protein (TIGR02218 family)
MKTASTALETHLALGQTTLAFLWKVKRVDGTILGFTTHDVDIVYDAGDGDGSVTYLARTGFTNTAVSGKSDLSVDNLEVTAFLDSEAITENDIRNQLYDDATIAILLVNWADLTMGHMIWRTGTLGHVKMRNGLATTEIRGLTSKLTTVIGDTFGPVCRAIFGSGLNGIDMNSKYLCKVDVVALRQTGSVASSADAWSLVPNAGLTGAAGYFDDGIIKFTSGQMNGLSFEIKTWDGTTLELFAPLPEGKVLAPGDTFQIEPGCKHDTNDCQNKFSNIVNFRGEPFIPGMDQVLYTPNAG